MAYHIGGYIERDGERRLGFSREVPREYVGSRTAAPIMFLEVLAAYIALIKEFRNLIIKCCALFDIDNQSGEYNIIADHNKARPATSELVELIHEEVGRLRAIVWWEYVLTDLNLADGLSRERWKHVARDLDIDLVRDTYPPPLVSSTWV